MPLPGARDCLKLLYALQRVRFGVEEIVEAGPQNQPAGIVRVEMQRGPWLPAGKPAPPAAIVGPFLRVTNFLKVWIHITHCCSHNRVSKSKDKRDTLGKGRPQTLSADRLNVRVSECACKDGQREVVAFKALTAGDVKQRQMSSFHMVHAEQIYTHTKTSNLLHKHSSSHHTLP